MANMSGDRGTTSAQPYISQLESLILQDGPINEDAAELLEEFAGTHHHPQTTLVGSGVEEDDGDKDGEDGAGHWRKPSPWWLLCIVPFSAIAQSATLAPKVELYTMLACRTHKPDIFDERTSVWGLEKRTNTSTMSNTASASLVSLPSFDSSTLKLSHDDMTTPSSCVSDPTVQAAVAKLSAAVTTTMGILSLLTTAWWGSLSDRRGRVFVMGVSLIGLLVTDFNIINVYYFSKYLPGGYWFLLIGSFIEGSLGGFTTAVAAIYAYLADTTSEGTRVRIFSLNLGLVFLGMAIGPTLGSLLIRGTGKTISIFYMATFLHCLYAIFVWTSLPESLSRKQMKRSGIKYERELDQALAAVDESSWLKFFASRGKRVFKFLSPLAIFFPELKPNRNPLKKPARDWSLTLMAIGYGFTISIMASYSYTFQYAAATFSWTSVQLGYYLSLVGTARAVFLAVVLPIIIKLFKPEPLVIEIPHPTSSSERQPLLSASSSSVSYSSASTDRTARPTIKKELHSPAFELGVARVSLVIEIISYSLMGLAPTGTKFANFGLLAAMGVGFSPAVQTVTLAMYARNGGTETGRLFGAMSVVQALGSQVLGPPIYGLVYMKTVAVFPRAIFLVIVSGLIISLILFTFVRLPKDAELKREILDAYSRTSPQEEAEIRDP